MKQATANQIESKTVKFGMGDRVVAKGKFSGQGLIIGIHKGKLYIQPEAVRATVIVTADECRIV